MKKVKNFVLAIGCSVVVALPSSGSSQEACTIDEVEAALEKLSCFSDGAYISIQTAAEFVVNRCDDEFDEESCRRCFRRASARILPGLKALGRAGLIERELWRALRPELRAAEEETCYFPEDSPPEEPPIMDTPVPPTPQESGPSQRSPGNSGRTPKRPGR